MENIVDKLKNLKYSIKQRLIGLKAKSISGANAISINDASGNNAIAFGIKGNSKQETRSGKNIYDYKNAEIVFGAGELELSIERINYGAKLTSLASSQWLAKVVVIDTVENLEGKQLTVSTDVVLSSEENRAEIDIIYCDETGENRQSIKNNNIYSSGKITCTTDAIQTGENRYYVAIRIYANINSNFAIGDYTEYKNIMVSTDGTTDFEEYGASPSPEFPSEIESVSGRNKLNYEYIRNWNNTTLNAYRFVEIKGIDTTKAYTISGIDTSEFENGVSNVYMLWAKDIGIDNLMYTAQLAGDENKLRYDKTTLPANLSTTGKLYLAILCTASSGTTEEVWQTVMKKFEKAMLVEGTVASSFIPYNHIGFKSNGKNLCKTNDFTYDTTNLQISIDNGFINVNSTSSNCHIDLNGGIRTGQWQPNYNEVRDYKLTPANQKQYVAKLFVNELSTTGGGENFFTVHTNQRNIVTRFTDTSSTIENKFTLAENEYVKEIALWINGANTSVILKGTVQLEQGEATEYEPYKENIVTFPLSEGQKLYKDTYLADDGIHHKRKQVVLDGTETVNYYGIEGTTYAFIVIVKNAKRVPSTNVSVLSNKLLGTSLDYLYNKRNLADYDLVAQKNDASQVVVMVNNIQTIEELKAYFTEQYTNGTPVIVEYELAEEETIPYTEEQKEAYNRLKTFAMFKGVNYIEVLSNIEPSEVNIEYYSDEIVSLDNYKFEVKEI